MNLYERIKRRREELSMSQDELAKKMGYSSRSTIAKIESGVNDITQSKIIAFAKALETTPMYLMGWEEAKKEAPVLNQEERDEEFTALFEKYKTLPKSTKQAFLNLLQSYDQFLDAEKNNK